MKSIVVDGIGEVIFKKSKKAKRLILRYNRSGKPQVTVPYYVPYYIAQKFAAQNRAWLEENAPKISQNIFLDGKTVGKYHTLKFISDEKATSTRVRVMTGSILVTHPSSVSPLDSSVQQQAERGSIRALRRQAELELPSRLSELAKRYGYKYSEVRIKTTYTRWGSCSSGRIINLSIWLMQLPEHLTDYVICHELAHLRHMNHSPDFWHEVSKMVPSYNDLRRELKEYRPALLLN